MARIHRYFLVLAIFFTFVLLVGLFFGWNDQVPSYLRDNHFSLGLSRPAPAAAAPPPPPPRLPEVHPIEYLVSNARDSFSQVTARQSQTLEEAVHEYQRRYGISPPPNFDKWYEFAVSNNVRLIDEYDTINELLLPMWAFSPFAIRQKVKKAFGGNDHVLQISIRGDNVAGYYNKGTNWRLKIIRNTIQIFAEWLPDMDMVFNMHDEPRVIIPHDDLARLVKRGREVRKTVGKDKSSASNVWSSPAKDLIQGFYNTSIIRPFNEYAHQFTWAISRSSCPPDSPARSLDLDGYPADDDTTPYIYPPLNFVQNHTLMTDICQMPSLENTYGFFNKPNAWSVSHDFLPIFSPSKISSFSDILYPAPWYLQEMVSIDDAKDLPWEEKADLLYWRGTTTSGFSEQGVWPRQNRQRFMTQAEKPGREHILKLDSDSELGWQLEETDRSTLQHLYNTHFTFIGQTSKEDRVAQKKYFDVRPDEDFQNVTLYKYLLDLDGNAFSGRFHAFLGSHGLAVKMALFREWHNEVIMPWVHYIPLNLYGSDHFEVMRYLTQESKGQELAAEIARESREWAHNVLRQVDMQAYIFRLLLE
ncbi:hypothetical protein B0A52_07867 [Exophiala mesophila]|uniref:Glycosyl transferase CAP10 domain-containing protein n=1 Tax=Exophiala mesophila TaxID=212818 RepID=A0A438MXR7_EXOME|nr:hypothetical protein B0A52_07867 [Exophiala mesophila]